MAKYKTQESTKLALKSLNARRVVGSLSQRHFAIFIARCFKLNQKRSSVLIGIVKEKLESLPENEKQMYLDLYKTLSSEQIKNIGKRCEDAD